MKTNRALLYFSFLFFTFCFTRSGFAQPTAFTYQGRLDESSGPANGSYDFKFQLFDAVSGGASQGGLVTNVAVNVSGGLFTVTLDFGNQFPGADRWLEIAVRKNGAGAFGVLSPRQLLAATPYAVRAANATTFTGSVAASQLTGTIASNNIGAGTITTAMLASGAVGANQLASGAVTTTALAEGAVTSAKVATVSNWFAFTIANPTPADDYFGASLAALGADRVLIGAPFKTTDAPYAGAAYLFSTNGTLLTTFNNPTPQDLDYFGESVAVVGNSRVLIGASGDSSTLIHAGAAYLFSTNGTLITTFNNPDPFSVFRFGLSVAAMGSSRVLIGAPGDLERAYLFSTNGTLLTTFTNPTPAIDDFFGIDLTAVGTDKVLITAPGDDTGAVNAGAAYLFNTNGTLLTIFTNPTPAAEDNFGASVATLSSDRVLIGVAADDAGAAYLFSINGTLLTTFTNPTPASTDQFGVSVAAVGSDRVLIGANSDDTGALNAGAAYLFSTNGTLLNTFNNPTPAAFDNFGISVAVVGNDRVLISASGDDTGAPGAGAAYLFSTASYTPGLIADEVAPRSITTASLEDGAVTAAKIGGVLFDSQIPDLDAAKITSGTLNTNRIPNLEASKITSGTINDARLSANVALLNTAQTFSADKTFGAGAQLFADAGSATAPSLSFNADGDTGLFRPALNTIAFATAGSEAMRISSTGNVGIGTSNPTRELEVQNGGDVEIGIKSTDADGHLWTLQSSGVTGDVNRDASLQVIDRTANTSRLIIATNGNVGIGTVAPAGKLHVNGTAGNNTGVWSNFSDRRLKDHIASMLAGSLDQLLRLEGVTYEYTRPELREGYGGLHRGWIAQQVEEVFPEWVSETSDGMKMVTPVGFNALTVEALRELRTEKDAQFKKLEAENAELKRELSEIKQLLLKLSAKKD